MLLVCELRHFSFVFIFSCSPPSPCFSRACRVRTTAGTLISCDPAARELILFWSATERFVLKSDLGPDKLLVKTEAVELIQVKTTRYLLGCSLLVRSAQAERTQRRAEFYCKD